LPVPCTLYDGNPEPTASTPVTVTLRTCLRLDTGHYRQCGRGADAAADLHPQPVSRAAHRLYAFGRFDANSRIAVILNNASSTETVTIPAWQLSMVNGSWVADLLTGSTYQVINGSLTASVEGRYGAILEQ
jgi:hypothetical protein